MGWLIHAGPGRARIWGSVAVLTRWGVFGPGCGQRLGAFLCNPVGEAVVHVGRGVETDAGVLMVMDSYL